MFESLGLKLVKENSVVSKKEFADVFIAGLEKQIKLLKKEKQDKAPNPWFKTVDGKLFTSVRYGVKRIAVLPDQALDDLIVVPDEKTLLKFYEELLKAAKTDKTLIAKIDATAKSLIEERKDPARKAARAELKARRAAAKKAKAEADSNEDHSTPGSVN